MACAATIVGAGIGMPWPSAQAISPPAIDSGALGAAQGLSGRPAPLEPTEQRSVCAEPVLTGSPPSEPPMAQRVLDLPSAWQFSRGAGQKVAVIDTGVNPHPRLRSLQPGGDFVSDSDGTVDCDGHGTLVAGIIAAQPSPGDAFAGVAPDADLLTIRQLSLAYEPKDRSGRDDPPGKISSDGYGSVLTLAAAVVPAAESSAVMPLPLITATIHAAAAAATADAAAPTVALTHGVVLT
ncbi:S8 family serine peptidase, partial [Nocardia abscessus]|uniref:S8 family serine peptidase n=1 Tax=Nocardia abscessus TaxID=120957 RepID=UPI0024545ED1